MILEKEEMDAIEINNLKLNVSILELSNLKLHKELETAKRDSQHREKSIEKDKLIKAREEYLKELMDKHDIGSDNFSYDPITGEIKDDNEVS